MYNRILEKVTHYAGPKGAHQQMWMFTHWFDFVKLGTTFVIMVTTLKISCPLTTRFTWVDHIISNVLFGWLLTSRLWQNLNTL